MLKMQSTGMPQASLAGISYSFYIILEVSLYYQLFSDISFFFYIFSACDKVLFFPTAQLDSLRIVFVLM